jgi:hypothetical protein
MCNNYLTMIRHRRALLLAAVLFSLSLSSCARSTSGPSASKDAVMASRPNTNSAEPGIAASADGRTFVVWMEYTTGKSGDVYVRSFTASNQTGDPVRVNPGSGQATAWFGDPPTIAIGPDGSVFVGWTSKLEGAKVAASTLYLSVSRDNGKSFDAPVKVNDDQTPASHGMHSLAVDKEGRIYFSWLDERYLHKQHAEHQNDQPQFATALSAHETPTPTHSATEPNAEVYFAVSNDGLSFNPNRRIAADACPCCKTATLIAPDGRVYIGFRKVFPPDLRHIAITTASNPDAQFSEPVMVSDDQWHLAACPVSGPSMLLDGTGGLNVAWFTQGDAGQQGVYLSRSTDNAATFSTRFLISPEATAGTPTLLPGNLIWPTTDGTASADLDLANFSSKNRANLPDAKHPVAVRSGDKLIVAFTKESTGSKSVWLQAE